MAQTQQPWIWGEIANAIFLVTSPNGTIYGARSSRRHHRTQPMVEHQDQRLSMVAASGPAPSNGGASGPPAPGGGGEMEAEISFSAPEMSVMEFDMAQNRSGMGGMGGFRQRLWRGLQQRLWWRKRLWWHRRQGWRGLQLLRIMNYGN